MDIALTPEQLDFVRHAVETGRVKDPDEAVQEALSLWVERERRRVELVAGLEMAEASLARGEGIAVTRETMKALAHEVMERHRNNFRAERPTGA